MNWRWKIWFHLGIGLQRTCYYLLEWQVRHSWVEQACSKVHLPSILHGASVGEMNVMMNLNMYKLQAMSIYTYSLRVGGGKLFLRACPVAVKEWHVHYT